MTAILGLNAYHPDSAACVLVDGRLVAAVAEERLGNRVKHCSRFPAEAARRVLEMAGLELKDIDHVALGHDNNANLGPKLGYVLRRPVHTVGSVLGHLDRRRRMTSIRSLLAEACGASPSACRFRIWSVEHHLAHVASAFYSSGFERAAGFSYDGSGDFVSGMFAICEGESIRVLSRIHVPHSLGFFYTAVCQFIGFDRFGEEYKVMGLSAYGEPAYMDLMNELLRAAPEGSFRINEEFLRPVGGNVFEQGVSTDGQIVLPALYSRALADRLGPPRRRDAPITQREMDLASSCQKHFEDVVLSCVNWLHGKVPVQKLVTAGGCALNGVCNARILRETPFEEAYLQCAASDDGTALGAAQYVWHKGLGKPRVAEINHAYWGPEYSRERIAASFRKRNLQVQELEETELLERTAEHLARGDVVGWYQGRSEWGPRALGNRSILAHPGWPGMKDLINKKIKRRESFRPFAPSILADRVLVYFEQDVESPFMMHVVRIRPEKRQELAAVCHEDGTGRLHTVRRTQNRLYHDLITRFSTKSGTPVLLNTSFNENEPIVDTPEQALDCYLRNDVDVLVLGGHITCKPGRWISSDEMREVGKSTVPELGMEGRATT